ncbi:hypothetical protein ONS95_013815 [Cadophora gregata]|uniref:uncharacterized protein n=1 Tax=Cadophora gregata TaxID=51156 RepID=UPI0026DA919C|nr:uncharacterized protein ONS95_013815 [Cadophora gregata]KAK0113565.1 hypothetical protein ONS96_014423 [Cadophora gregata f. sp. sojae]KAK0114321.1 hypothetical protein ONS95_013815 [Cadophora gregata]
MAAEPSLSYLVVGAGVFGALTAHQLAKKYPGSSISLIDRAPYPCPLGASWDWNKIIRADYGDLFYMKKALDAIDMWRNDPLYHPFYHQSGLVNNINNTGLGQRMIDNYKNLYIAVDPRLVSVQDF